MIVVIIMYVYHVYIGIVYRVHTRLNLPDKDEQENAAFDAASTRSPSADCCTFVGLCGESLESSDSSEDPNSSYRLRLEVVGTAGKIQR